MNDDSVVSLHGGEIPDPPEAEEVVVPLGAMTKLDLPPERVLLAAAKEDLSGVVLVGFREDGTLFFSGTYSNGATVLWLLEKAKQCLMDITD